MGVLDNGRGCISNAWGKHALSGEENHYDSFDDLDEEMEELIDDEQGKLFLQNDTSLSKDRMDNGSENFVKEEGPNQIKNLIFEEHVDNVMFGDISKWWLQRLD